MTRDGQQVRFEAALLASARDDRCPTTAESAWHRLERDLVRTAALAAPTASPAPATQSATPGRADIVASSEHARDQATAAGQAQSQRSSGAGALGRAHRRGGWALAVIGVAVGSSLTLLLIEPDTATPSVPPALSPAPNAAPPETSPGTATAPPVVKPPLP
ncbi:MAG: hypothetical protein OXR73_27775, partial [Myxococcales bacterium]|nr:hypothetical protein [Myxococcales bacterium]